VEIVRIFELYEQYQRNTINLKNCQEIYSGYSYRFQIEKERRLHSIRLRTTYDTWNSLKKAELIFQGWIKDRYKFENLNVSRTDHELNFSSSLVLNGSSDIYLKSFRVTSNAWFRICEIVLLPYHDVCGHPEIPLHGNVAYKPGDAKAIYRCDDGYQLDSNYSTRHCIQGRWNGSQRICSKLILD
jgi:Sushi repeat (SCR repeat)